MLTLYLKAAMRHYEIIEDENPYYGSIAACQGVWATGKTLEECREDLESALEDWIVFSLAERLGLPVIDGIDWAVQKVA